MLPNCLLTHLASEQALAVMEDGVSLGNVRRKWDSARWRELQLVPCKVIQIYRTCLKIALVGQKLEGKYKLSAIFVVKEIRVMGTFPLSPSLFSVTC